MLRESLKKFLSPDARQFGLPIVDEEGRPVGARNATTAPSGSSDYGAGSLQPRGGFWAEAWLGDENDTRKGDHSGIQHIGFKLHTEEFLLPVTFVREIVMLPHITFVPRSELCIEGIIALRGEIMPVMNLRRLLNFPEGRAEASTRVVILHTELGSFGLIVDEITDFVWLEEADIESIAQNFFSAEYKVLSGVAKLGERVRGIIEVNKLLFHLNPEKDAV